MVHYMFQKKLTHERLTSNYTLINVPPPPPILYLSIFDLIFRVFVSQSWHILRHKKDFV